MIDKISNTPLSHQDSVADKNSLPSTPTDQSLPLEKVAASKAHQRKFKNESVTQKNLLDLLMNKTIEKSKVKDVQILTDDWGSGGICRA